MFHCTGVRGSILTKNEKILFSFLKQKSKKYFFTSELNNTYHDLFQAKQYDLYKVKLMYISGTEY